MEVTDSCTGLLSDRPTDRPLDSQAKGQPPCHLAVREETDTGGQEPEGDMPLHLAIEDHTVSEEVCRQLLSSHNINMANHAGLTPLHVAVQAHRWGLVPLMLQRGADRNQGDRSGRTPLMACLEKAAGLVPYDVILQLITYQNVNHIAQNTRLAPIHVAFRRKRWDLMQLFLQRGANPFLVPEESTMEHMDMTLRTLGYVCEAMIQGRQDLVSFIMLYGENPGIPQPPFCLKLLAALAFRRNMSSTSEEAYGSLCLPLVLVDIVKLRHVGEIFMQTKEERDQKNLYTFQDGIVIKSKWV